MVHWGDLCYVLYNNGKIKRSNDGGTANAKKLFDIIEDNSAFMYKAQPTFLNGANLVVSLCQVFGDTLDLLYSPLEGLGNG